MTAMPLNLHTAVRLALLALACSVPAAWATDLLQAWQAAEQHDRGHAVARAAHATAQPRRDQAAALWRPNVALMASAGVGSSDTDVRGAQFAAPGLALFFRQYACEALQISVEEFDRLAVSAPRRAGDTHVRPCPCCGLMATQISNDCGHRIECSDCGLTTKLTTTDAECRSLWNRREKPRQ